MPNKTEHASSSHELMTMIIDEVDDAREVLELAQQLIHALPLHSFEDVVKAVGPKGIISFRGRPQVVQKFTTLVPAIVFPIDTPQKLITLLYETVRLAPTSIKYNDTDASYAKRKLRGLGILGLKRGVLGRAGSLGSRGSKFVAQPTGIISSQKRKD